MNSKVITGVIVALAVIGGAYYLLQSAPAIRPIPNTPPVSLVASTTPPIQPVKTDTHTGSEPTFTTGTPSVKIIPASAEFDSPTFTSSSTYPLVTGTANSQKVGIVINNSKNVGLVGTWEIPVTDGHWSYSTSVALTPGTYTALLFIGPKNVSTAQIVVTK